MLTNTFIRGRARARVVSQTFLSIRENHTHKKCPFHTPYHWGIEFLHPDVNPMATPGILAQHPHVAGKFYGPKEKDEIAELNYHNNEQNPGKPATQSHFSKSLMSD